MNNTHANIEALVKIVREHLGTDEPGPDTDDLEMIATYWIQRYFESRGYTYYSRAQSAKPVKTKLAERGWFLKWRVPSMIDPKGRPPRLKYGSSNVNPLKGDSVARVSRRMPIDETLVKTPQELIEEARKETRQGELDAANRPTNSQDLHAHLVKLAPMLQTRYRFVDERSVNYGMAWRELMEISVPGYIRTEYWESVKTGEALWVFTAFRVRRRESDRRLPSYVWWKVKGLEKLAEYPEEPLNRAPEGDEDPEVRQAVKELYWEGELASFEEWTENQP